MRVAALLTALCFASSASAQSIDTETLFENGLAAAETRLGGNDAAEAKFLLAGTRFLRAIETAFQARWRMGLAEAVGPLPLLRTDIAPNPAPEPFDPAFIETLFENATSHMESARIPLESISDADAFSLPVDLSTIWLDVNMNATRDRGEGILELGGNAFAPNRRGDGPAPSPVVDFDTSDAAWLLAYTHLISGFSEIVLAFHPTDVIAEVLEKEAALKALNTGFTAQEAFVVDDSWVLLPTIYLKAIEVQPIAAHTRAARDHLVEMVAANRVFWARVRAETDAGREWIPNDAQTSALGLPFPKGTADVWLEVLGDVEKLFKGDLLIGHWRLSADNGINLHAVMENPPQIDIIDWIQGGAALPYLEKGTRISGENWRAFERLMRGQGLMFAVMLN